MMIAFVLLLIVDITYSLPVRINDDDYFKEENIHLDKIPIRKRSIEEQQLRDVKVQCCKESYKRNLVLNDNIIVFYIN